MRKIEQNQNEREKNKKKKTKDMSMKQRLDGSKDDKKESDESKPIKEKKTNTRERTCDCVSRMRFAHAELPGCSSESRSGSVSGRSANFWSQGGRRGGPTRTDPTRFDLW